MTDDNLDAKLAAAIETIRRSQRGETDRLFAQLEALIWLRDMLKLDWPLPPTRGWAASPDLLLEVVKRIADGPPRAVVELGSGTSTVVIAGALRRFAASGRLVSIEHELEHADRTRSEIARHGLTDWATVLHAPLGEVDLAGTSWRWYSVPEDALPEVIDMVFVDGPPGGTGPLARYPAVPFLRSRLSDSVVIYLDDGVRQDEKEIALRWQREDATLVGREIPSEKQAWEFVRR